VAKTSHKKSPLPLANPAPLKFSNLIMFVASANKIAGSVSNKKALLLPAGL